MEQKHTATSQNPENLRKLGALELNLDIGREESVKVEALPEEIEAAHAAAKACKKATKKIEPLRNKLLVLKVQFGTRGRTECADKAESAATAQDLAKINTQLEEFMEKSNALCVRTGDLDQEFTENPEAAIASAVSLAKELGDLRAHAEEHLENGVKKLKMLHENLNQVCLHEEVQVKEEVHDEA